MLQPVQTGISEKGTSLTHGCLAVVLAPQQLQTHGHTDRHIYTHTHTDTRTHRQTDSYPHTWTNQRTKPDKRCHVQTTIDLVAVASAVHSILLAYSTQRPYCMLSIFRILSFLGQPTCGSKYMQVRPSGRIRLVSHQPT